MRLLHSLLVGACVVSSAIAGSSKTFDVVTQELHHVRFLTNNLTDAIAAWDGHNYAAALENIHYPSQAMVDYVINATDVLKQYPTTFDLTQAFRIGSPAQRLAYAVNASIATLERRGPEIKTMLMEPVVVLDLSRLLNATRGFSAVLSSYVPKDLRPVATTIQGQFVASLQQGIDCFSGQNNVCQTAIVDPNRTYKLAIKYNAMKPNGYPIA